MKLVYDDTGEEVQVGDTARTFRGDEIRVAAVVLPAHGGSTGRVYVKYVDDWMKPVNTREFFPSVIGATWVDREDQS